MPPRPLHFRTGWYITCRGKVICHDIHPPYSPPPKPLLPPPSPPSRAIDLAQLRQWLIVDTTADLRRSCRYSFVPNFFPGGRVYGAGLEFDCRVVYFSAVLVEGKLGRVLVEYAAPFEGPECVGSAACLLYRLPVANLASVKASSSLWHCLSEILCGSRL